MMIFTATTILVLLVATDSAISEKVLYQINPKLLLDIADIKVPGFRSEDGSMPCNLTLSSEMKEAISACSGRSGMMGKPMSDDMDELPFDLEPLKSEEDDEDDRKRRSADFEDDAQPIRSQQRSGGGRSGARRKGSKKMTSMMVMEKCVLTRLGVIGTDGSFDMMVLQSKVSALEGPQSGKDAVLSSAKRCSKNMTSPADSDKMLECFVKQKRRSCFLHDVGMMNSDVASIIAHQVAAKCSSAVELPVKASLAKMKCFANEKMMIATERLNSMSRTKRAADRAEGGGMGGPRGRNGERRRQQGRAGNRRPNSTMVAERRARLEALYGPLNDSIPTANKALMSATKCWHQEISALNGDSVNLSAVEQVLSEATGPEEVINKIEGAYDTCHAQDPNVDKVTLCVANEVAISSIKMRGGKKGGKG